MDLAVDLSTVASCFAVAIAPSVALDSDSTGETTALSPSSDPEYLLQSGQSYSDSGEQTDVLRRPLGKLAVI